jgi:cold shock CspA family protein
MSRAYLLTQLRKTSLAPALKPARPGERSGVPDKGRIVKLYVGQAYGFIRLADGRDIYFHRADMEAGVSFNDCHIGDTVRFDRVDDVISGARARYVRRL